MILLTDISRVEERRAVVPGPRQAQSNEKLMSTRRFSVMLCRDRFGRHEGATKVELKCRLSSLVGPAAPK